MASPQLFKLGCIVLKSKEIFLCLFEQKFIQLHSGRVSRLQAPIPTCVHTNQTKPLFLFSLAERLQVTWLGFVAQHMEKKWARFI